MSPTSLPDTSLPNSNLPDTTLRLDVWLYRTRLFKTRSLAAKTLKSGKIHLCRNGQTSRVKKSHHHVRAGDGLSFMRGQTLLNLRVIAMPTRRGPATEARTHYELTEITANPVDK